MGYERSFAPGETVYLLAEVGVEGQIHEIGTRAIVRAVAAGTLTLELGGSSAAVVCPPTQVEPGAARRRRGRPRGRLDSGLRLAPG